MHDPAAEDPLAPNPEQGPPPHDGSPGDQAEKPAAAGANASSIPAAAVGRLSLYLRELRHLRRERVTSISSHDLGRRLGVSAAIVRRDLAHLGQLGRRGVGYDVAGLTDRVRSALGVDQLWNVALVGAGSLGNALLRYRGFSEQGFRVLAAFDVNSERIGKRVGGVPVLDMQDLEATVAEREIALAILAVPAEAAQGIADRLARSAVTGILNFAPVTLRVTGETCVVNVDLASELQQLSFAVARRAHPADRPAPEPPSTGPRQAASGPKRSHREK